MVKIGLLSDTHGWLNPAIYDFFKDCDEIWHAGDIGSDDVAIELEAFVNGQQTTGNRQQSSSTIDRDASMSFSRKSRFRAVYGNIDDWDIRADYPQFQIFTVEDVKVVMTHIGGYPNAYAQGIRQLLSEEKPDIFISGHSHILKVMRDPKLNLLHLNPGAAGLKGFHKKVTMLRFTIEGKEAKELEIYEADRY